MPWIRLDDSFADHPKVERVGPLAAWLHVTALCYCGRHLTDGRIPKTKALRLADVASPQDHVDALVRVGLWHEDGDDYVIHDYLEYQPSRADVEHERATARERMSKKRRKTEERSDELPPNNGRSSSTPSHPIPSDLSSRRLGNSRSAEPANDDDTSISNVPDEVWALYAEHKFARQPKGKVDNVIAYKLTTGDNARRELGERAEQLWNGYSLTPEHLAQCLVDGKAPGEMYRRKDPA